MTLRELRNAKRLSLKDVAPKAGIWPSDLSEYERGRRPVPQHIEERIRAAIEAMPVKQSAPRGFASMDDERRKVVAQMGGKRAHELGHAHRFTAETARQAGLLGGKSVAMDAEHMRKIGQRGGWNAKGKHKRRSPTERA